MQENSTGASQDREESEGNEPSERTERGGEDWGDGQPRPVDPNSVQVARLAGLLWVAILAVLTLIPLMILTLATDLPAKGLVLLGWFGLMVVLGGLAIFWPPLRYRHLRWWLDAQGMRIQRGVMWRAEIAVPTSRVQHTDVSQGPLQRSFGIADLVIHTAGTVNASITLPGLSHPVAIRLRDLLLEGGEDDGV